MWHKGNSLGFFWFVWGYFHGIVRCILYIKETLTAKISSEQKLQSPSHTTILQLHDQLQLRDSQDHAEHDEDVPQSDEDPKVPQAEQKLSDVVT